MARAPSTRQQQYGYGLPQNYYYEDTEGYVGDFSESECPTDSGPPSPVHLMPPQGQRRPDLTELYRRQNQNISQNQRRFQQNLYATPEYYYDQIPGPGMNSPPIYRKCLVQHPPSPPPPRYYKEEDLMYQRGPVYHQSLPYVAADPRTGMVQKIPSASLVRPKQIIRKHPVTVRTPRYIRRPMSTSLYKRPSALCLPLACQLDPGRYRKVRRQVIPSDMPYQQDLILNQKPVARRHSISAPLGPSHLTKPRLDPKKSLDISQSRLDAILERYERIFSKTPDNKFNNLIGDQQLLKPRLPPCLKEKHLKILQQKPTEIEIPTFTKEQIPELMKHAETLQVEEVSSEVLQELLAELTEQGFHNINEDDKKKKTDHKASSIPASPKSPRIEIPVNINHLETQKTSKLDVPVKDMPKSYNYQEIKDSLSKSNNREYISESDDGRSQKTVKSQIAPSTSSRVTKVSKSPSRLSAQEALELHRTKSYVVNLIDTALSNHFGTSVSEKSSNKYNLDAKSAVEMLKKHSNVGMEKDLCLGLAQALTDSCRSDPKTASQCSCKSISSCGKEDATFIKQLRQMRWGHLKHIQREVRRLEDLERFLDSCNVTSFEKQ